MADVALQLAPTAVGTDAYGDLLWVGNTLVLTSDADARGTDVVRQRIFTRLRLYLGEFFMDTSTGVPWLQQVLVPNPDATSIDAIVQDVILGTPGVGVLTQFAGTLDKAHRSYSVRFTVVTAKGTRVAQSITVGA
ncbi:MAG: hypothetical protein EOO40_03540 [Deltaproteobacteria bacterium]|nr:MAG: hypothetical protein EOO40_03540 [Deltaproteobacteria bacterium]